MKASKTFLAVNKFVEDNAEEPFRAHLGASVIGDECARKVWYGFHWTLAEKFDARMLRLFERGHLEENRFIEYLRGIGCEIWPFNPDAPLKNGKPQQWRIRDHEGHFGGSPDGVGRGLPDLPPGEPFLCEFKTHNAKSFAKLVDDGLMRTKWKHFVQTQILMLKLEIKFALYCAVNKDTDELHFEIIQADEKEGKRALERAGGIIWSSEPPPRIHPTPAGWGCKYCHLSRLCHFGDVMPARNCRTCQHSEPAKDSSGPAHWNCNLHSLRLDEAAQRAGCIDYRVNPELQKPS